MKRLEREAGIYALGEPYAYYDKPRTTWTCGAMHAEILFDKIQRENPIAGEPPVYIRGFPRLSIRIGSRSVLHMLPVYPYSVTAYGDYEGKPNLRLCSREQRCIEPSMYGREPIDGQGADRLFKEAAELVGLKGGRRNGARRAGGLNSHEWPPRVRFANRRLDANRGGGPDGIGVPGTRRAKTGGLAASRQGHH